MVWNDLLEKIEVAQSRWSAIKKDLGEDAESKSFLSESYLVITSTTEQKKVAELPDSVNDAALQCAWVFKPTTQNQQFIDASKEHKKASTVLKDAAKGSRDESRALKALEKSNAFIADMLTDRLELQDDIAVEIRFKRLCIDIIQQIKQHPFVDRDETPMTPASVKVVLLVDKEEKK